MKIIFSFLILFYLLTSKVSADVSDKISAKVNDYFSNLVPGKGITEVSIDLRENNSPDFSILAVRELEKSISGNFFTQFSLFSTEQNNDERIVGVLGFGKRNLSKDKFTLTETNLFFD